jgi:hypothetical protein
MQLALRPYITTGVAIVGASAIAVAPMIPTPPAVQVSNPAEQVERAVELTANEIQNAFNALAFGGAQALVTLAELPAPLVAELLGGSDQAAALLLAGAALGLFGPAISGTGAIGTALQHIADSDDLGQLLSNLIGAPGTLIDGVVNGGYGPDLDDLLTGLSPIPVVAGGLLRGALPFGTVVGSPLRLILPGTIPTLQGLAETLFGLLSPAQMATVNSSLAVAAPDSTVEDGINDVVFTLTKITLSIVQLAAPLVAPILGVDEDQAAPFLALGTVGLLGPLISGTGAVGAALQNVINSDGVEGLITNLIGAPGIIADGVVNGGYGPNLLPLLPALKAIPGATMAFAPGFIQNPGFIYGVIPGGIGIKPTSATTLSVLPPGTIAVLQGLVERVIGALPSNQMASTFNAPANGPDLTISSEQNNLTLNENKDGTDLAGQAPTDGPEVTPKKHRQHFDLNVLNPLGNLGGAKKAEPKDAAALGNDNETSAKHRPGLDKTPVGKVINRVLSGGHDHDDQDNGGQPADDAPAG